MCERLPNTYRSLCPVRESRNDLLSGEFRTSAIDSLEGYLLDTAPTAVLMLVTADVVHLCAACTVALGTALHA